MDSSRDSSVWRSLAVTFGGGLALGAVGMKLTQTALRPAEPTPRPEPPDTLADRLATMERRLERMEQTPVATRPQTPPPAASMAIDQKVLEAVIGAVDARLHEHAGTIERRIADLEARIAVEVQGLHRQDRQAADASSQYLAEVRQIGERVSQAIAGQAAIHNEMQAIHQQNERLVDAAEQRFADMRFEYRQALAELRAGVTQTIDAERARLEQSMETRIITAAASAVAAQLDERLAPLRTEIQKKEQELAELRQRLAESEGTVLGVISSIGNVCRQAAQRIHQPEPSVMVLPPAPVMLPVAAEISPQAGAGPETAALATAEPELPPPAPPNVETLPVPKPAADPVLARAVPEFLQESDRATWRIPLVSSLLVTVTTGCLFLLHYL